MRNDNPEVGAGEPVETDDRALMERVQAGDDVAFGTLMERWELPVKAVIGRLVLNSAEAEELAQEVFVRVWQQRAKYRAGAEFRPWVFAIAINLARNRLRWWRRRPTVSFEAWCDAGVRGGGSLDRQQGLLGGADVLETRELADAVRDAIAALPVELREAIVLFEYEGMSQAEIAAVVGATSKAVETRIARARERLRVALRRWQP